MENKDIKILVVDDFELIQTIFKNSLLKLGYQNIDFASDGLEAWDKIRKSKENGTPYELVLLDWNTPRMDGYELLSKCRESQEFKDIPIIMVTAESELNYIIKAVSKGISGYIIKPFSVDILKQKINEAMKNNKESLKKPSKKIS